MWVPVENVCGVLDTQRSKKTILATLVTDLVLLFTMLFGLLRLRRHGTMFGLGQLLWKQVGNEVSRSPWSLIIFRYRVWFGSSRRPLRKSPLQSVRSLP